MKRIAIITGLTLVLLVALIFLLFIDNNNDNEVEVSFTHNNNHLSGTLITPEHRTGPFPVVVFVHGDGAMPYDAYGHFRPLWNRLAKSGIASYSWNKAGVGDSTGNWENQSMDDRADEVIAAIEMLRKREDIISTKIGLIGYSQAGWVLPLVSTKSDYPDFMIIVSGAINWMSQGNYLTEKQLTRAGYTQEQIKQAVNYHESTTKVLTPVSTYDDYIHFRNANYPEFLKNDDEPMTPDRFQFAKLNWQYDSRKNLTDISSPTLAIFGDQDVNVDFAESVKVYKDEFKKSGNNSLTVKVFTGAQHGLLKNDYFDDVIPGIWSVVKLRFLGDDAFIEGYLDYVVEWIEARVKE